MPTSLLILGGAKCVWSDLEQAESLCEFDAVMAVNDVGKDYPGRLDYWVTLHPEKLSLWRSERPGNADYEVWSHKGGDGIDHALACDTGGSGLFAIDVGLDQGFTRVVLAGMPMSNQAHYFDDAPWGAVLQFLPAWENALERLAPYVRSFSGWTREKFGEPTREWLVSRT